MACPCCREKFPFTCPGESQPRSVPSSVSVSINVTLTFARTPSCANEFPPKVNGTYVLSRIGSTYSYSGRFGDLFIGFTIDAAPTYSLLKFEYCEATSTCGPFSLVWLLDQAYPTLCGWPSGGAETFSSSDTVFTVGYARCIQGRIGLVNDYTGSFTVSLL